MLTISGVEIPKGLRVDGIEIDLYGKHPELTEKDQFSILCTGVFSVKESDGNIVILDNSGVIVDDEYILRTFKIAMKSQMMTYLYRKAQTKNWKEIKMQFKEKLKEVFKSAEGDVESSFMQQDISPEIDERWDDAEVRAFKRELADLGVTFDCEAHHGGEGQGEDYWSVYSFTDGTDTAYIKFQGYYASYSGSEFQEWFFVEPKTVEVVQYVAA